MSNVIWDSYWMFIKISYTIKSIADFFMISAKKSYCKVYTIQTQFAEIVFYALNKKKKFWNFKK